jgi:uncharacterized protein (TIGR02594 family)
MSTTPEAYNSRSHGWIWSLRSLPAAWAGTQILASSDSDHDGSISQQEAATVNWTKFSAAVVEFQKQGGVSPIDGKLGRFTLDALVDANKHAFPLPVQSQPTPRESLFAIADSQLGVREYPGAKHNPVIMAYMKSTGLTFSQGDEIAWCSIFANWVCLNAGTKRSNNAMARSWMKVGTSVDAPALGDIVVFWRESKSGTLGHVAFYHSMDDDKDEIYVLGGNQNNRVCVMAYPQERILGFRRLV